MAPVKTITSGSHTLEYYYYSIFDPRVATTWPSVDRCPSKYKRNTLTVTSLYIPRTSQEMLTFEPIIARFFKTQNH